jgi:hypothetical protein
VPQSPFFVKAVSIQAVTEAAPAPTAFISWAHKPNEGLDPDYWVRQVFNFTNALRSVGVDADVDLFHLQDLGINWAHYGPGMIRQSDFTVVPVNHAWKERFQGDNPPTGGAGAAAEANVLHGLFATNQAALAKRLVLVVLPGGTLADVPDELQGFQRIEIADLSPSGITPLLRLLLQQQEWPPVPVGQPPILERVAVFEPPTAREVDQAMAEIDDAVGPHDSPDTSPVPGVDVEGWPDVNRALALNPFGHLVRELLATVAAWPDVSVRGKRNRAKGLIEYDKYLGLAVPGRPIFGYVWPKTGIVNPRAMFTSSDELAAVADRATFLPSKTNANYPVRFDITDRAALGQALRMLEAARLKG